MILDINVLTYNPLRVAEVWMDDYRCLQSCNAGCISFCLIKSGSSCEQSELGNLTSSTQLEYFLPWIPFIPLDKAQSPDSCTTTGTGVGTSRSPVESGTLETFLRGELSGRGCSVTLSNGPPPLN